jgi:hypothetical protein
MNAFVVNNVNEIRPAGGVAEELDVDGTVVSPAALAVGAKYALVGVKNKGVLATFDGTDPVSSAAGVYYPAGNYVWRRELVGAAKLVEALADNEAVVRFEPMVV